LYDYGMLDTAKAWLREILDTLRPELEAGTPIVGLEPSCVSVFRDELRNLFPADQDARRLADQSFLLSEFLVRKAPDFQYPKLARHVLVHGHCHHKALMKMTAEQNVLTQMALTVSAPDAGCCGMAGAFGFESDHYDVSMAVGERRLLPAVREADSETLIVADGFSCREQIVQSTGRRPLHLAEVIQLGLQQGPDGTPIREIERAYSAPRAWSLPSGRALAMVGAAAVGAGVALAIAGRRGRG
jgi:Fe-S oxidoreductase